MAEREVVFVDAVRTAFGRMGGTLRDITAEELGGIGIKGLIDKTQITEKAHVDCVMMGSAAHCSKAINPARWSSLYAGLPYETSASFVEMQCGSGIDAINHAAWKILCNQADIIIAGGTESYSQQTVKFSMSMQPYKLIPPMPLPRDLSPVPEEASTNMGITAERLQVQYSIPRIESDRFALRSQVQARRAIDAGYFKDEIIPVTVPQGKKPPIVFMEDEHPRATSMEALSALPPAFKENGTVTAGNSSGRNDGSAFVLMMTRQRAKELGYEPMAKWLAGADYGCDPQK